MNYAADCDDCPTPEECRAKNDCQVARQIRHSVYCHACSVAGGAEKAIYHLPPACSSDDIGVRHDG